MDSVICFEFQLIESVLLYISTIRWSLASLKLDSISLTFTPFVKSKTLSVLSSTLLWLFQSASYLSSSHHLWANFIIAISISYHRPHHHRHNNHHRHHRPHRLWANFIFAIPNAIKLCCTTHCLSVDFAIGNGRKENLLGFNSKMKKKNQIVDLTYNINIANGTKDPGIDYFNHLLWFGLVGLV